MAVDFFCEKRGILESWCSVGESSGLRMLGVEDGRLTKGNEESNKIGKDKETLMGGNGKAL